MWRRIIAYLLFGLGFLTVTFFRKYSGEVIPYPSLFWLLGLVLFFGGFLFLRYTPTQTEISAKKKLAEMLTYLKANGERIHVDFTQCEIKEHNYIEVKQKYGHKSELLTLDIERGIQAWNAIGGDSLSNMKQDQINQAIIIFSHYNVQTGLTEKFISRVIPKDKITLSFYLDKQKETILFVDKTNRERYYFDLDFLAT